MLNFERIGFQLFTVNLLGQEVTAKPQSSSLVTHIPLFPWRFNLWTVNCCDAILERVLVLLQYDSQLQHSKYYMQIFLYHGHLKDSPFRVLNDVTLLLSGLFD